MLPAHRRNFSAEWQNAADRAEAAAARRQERVEERYNSHAADLTALKIGSRVAVKNQDTKRWDRYGEIVVVCKHRRYLIRLQSGRVLSRSRRHIRRRYGYALPEELHSGAGASPDTTVTTAPSAAPAPAAPRVTPAAVTSGATSPQQMAPPARPSTTPSESADPTTAAPPLRRSQRRRRRPQRLIETM